MEIGSNIIIHRLKEYEPLAFIVVPKKIFGLTYLEEFLIFEVCLQNYQKVWLLI